MQAPNDALLHIISARESLTWQQYKEVTDSMLVSRPGASSIQISTKMQRERLLRGLASLGHCDVIEKSGARKIYIAPSFAARTPIAGLPTAIICGSRSPKVGERLASLLQGTECRIKVEQQIDATTFLPDRISIEATNEQSLTHLCELLSIKTDLIPSGWSILKSLPTIVEYRSTLKWNDLRAPDWPRLIFDPKILRFVENSNFESSNLLLERYTHPRKNTVVHLLKSDIGRAICQLDLSRFIVLSHHARNVIYYDKKSGVLAIPISTPLPLLMARSIILCSGFAPQLVTWESLHIDTNYTGLFDLYRWVPGDFAKIIAETLGQTLHQHEIED